MESFGLSREDAQDGDYWRLRINGEPANPGLPGKWPFKRCVCVCVCALYTVAAVYFLCMSIFVKFTACEMCRSFFTLQFCYADAVGSRLG